MILGSTTLSAEMTNPSRGPLSPRPRLVAVGAQGPEVPRGVIVPVPDVIDVGRRSSASDAPVPVPSEDDQTDRRPVRGETPVPLPRHLTMLADGRTSE